MSYADGGPTRTAVCFSFLRFYIFVRHSVTFAMLGQVKEERGLFGPRFLRTKVLRTSSIKMLPVTVEIFSGIIVAIRRIGHRIIVTGVRTDHFRTDTK